MHRAEMPLPALNYPVLYALMLRADSMQARGLSLQNCFPAYYSVNNVIRRQGIFCLSSIAQPASSSAQ